MHICFLYLFYGTFHYLDEKKEVPVLLSGILEGLQLETCDANDVVVRLSLLLTKALLEKPGPETKRLIRRLCMEAKVKSVQQVRLLVTLARNTWNCLIKIVLLLFLI